jgi:hypothetical protein
MKRLITMFWISAVSWGKRCSRYKPPEASWQEVVPKKIRRKYGRERRKK